MQDAEEQVAASPIKLRIKMSAGKHRGKKTPGVITPTVRAPAWECVSEALIVSRDGQGQRWCPQSYRKCTCV